MIDDWTHWVFVVLPVVAVIIIVVWEWVGSRRDLREMTVDVDHSHVTVLYDWNQPYDWQTSEVYIPEGWTKEWI